MSLRRFQNISRVIRFDENQIEMKDELAINLLLFEIFGIVGNRICENYLTLENTASKSGHYVIQKLATPGLYKCIPVKNETVNQKRIKDAELSWT
ncbi:hypothetical protein EVAR_73835_1 [Eumeta japonica]|uniref:Uncharacterized protein n=1 Tax=Eumeta variegata TaxID=151549 RepID=A0A4C1SGK8_EUMVA|nr:hypothetical protein EVAR_73835_1 [Eumeta japonica]